MEKTNSYQRAKARVKELEQQIELLNVIRTDLLNDLQNNKSFISSYAVLINKRNMEIENLTQSLADTLTEKSNLKEELNKSIKTTKVFIMLSIQLVAIIIVLIANI